jgi:N-alpha-acetyltransferase 40
MSPQTRSQRNSKEPKLVESANALSGNDFFERYCPEPLFSKLRETIRRKKSTSYQFQLIPWIGSVMKGTSVFYECLSLIEQTSKSDYDGSGKKWSRSGKERELLLPDMKYILFTESTNLDGKMGGTWAPQVAGFISFMITYEDGHEVLYVYEIHLRPEWQGYGCGGEMMDVVEQVGRNVGVEKAMLTVYKSNDRAVQWYGRRGYVEDEFSPQPRTFRDGTVKEPTYLILSKDLRSNNEAEGGGDMPCTVNTEDGTEVGS